ncbi:MAG: UDP-N-acetylmuramoyl-tripeptide--D-alanyl-D-alanine ligase [Muribaculaceae bacterium]
MRIEDIVNVVFAAASLFNFAVMLKFDMQMMQQNSYRNERYIKWFKLNSEHLSMRRLVSLVCLMCALTTFAEASWYVIGILAAVLVVIGTKVLQKKSKKPLVFTKRVQRLYFTELVLMLLVLGAVYASKRNAYDVALVAIGGAVVSYLLTMAVNWLLKPVERAINNSYVNDAKRLLAGMSGMKIVGITGSYGKTSTKHYLNRILSEKYSVLMTPGSYNTPMGVVRTVREMMQPYNDLFIVEMGAKNVGDIKEICDIVHPQMGIVTAVGAQHLESFKSIENVQRTKFELVDALPADGFAVVNNDFPYVASREVSNVECKRYSVGEKGTADYKAVNIEYSAQGTSFTVEGEGKSIALTTKLVGECNISNLMAAVIMAMHLGVPEQKIKYAVSKIEQVEHRLNVKRTASGITIIDDAFNSNPDGSRMALDVLGGMKGGRRIVITPGMIELGDKQEFFNEKFGEHIAETCDVAIVVGQYNRDAILRGIRAKGMAEDSIKVADTFAEAQQMMLGFAKAGDTVLYENDLPDTFK